MRFLPLFVKKKVKSFRLSKLFPNFASSHHTRKMNKEFITLEESKDQLIGKVGTPERDAYEEELKLYAIGAAIRQTRKLQNLTQEELGRMVGVQKAQISRIENGKNLTFATVLKLFKAMNIRVKLDIDKLGRVDLF